MQLVEHIFIPAKIILDVVLRTEPKLFIKPTLPLQIARQVVIVGKVEALGEVLGDFAYHFRYLFIINILRVMRRLLRILLNNQLMLLSSLQIQAGDEGNAFQCVDSG